MLGTVEYYSKLYGGWVGKVIGVIHGANIEGWPYERIRESFGKITEYPFRFKNFCSDDDINGPLFYLRALADYEKGSEISVQELAASMLNYVGDGHGFFWWGGYGVSTEHTAYQNLMAGIPAPESGSIKQNGSATAEQIGGQIFSDCWGLVYPGRPKEAADLAEKMASITHDRNGVYGARFIAACIAKAFEANSVDEIIEAGLAQIPVTSEYYRMAGEVLAVCRKNEKTADSNTLEETNHPKIYRPKDSFEVWEESFSFVQEHFGYQHYEGSCHIIPNAAVILLALIHGKGEFSRSINIANMCGWDTDCNVGNLGAILGVYCKTEGIEEKWLPQVHDFICASSSLGYLNLQTVSQIAAYCAKLTATIYKEQPQGIWKTIFEKDEGTYFHFEFPTATHAMRVHSLDGKKLLLTNTSEEAHTGSRALKIVSPWTENGDSFQLYYKPYYQPQEFEDSRYDPELVPTLYPGDVIRAYFKGKDGAEYFDEKDTSPRKESGKRMRILPYYKDRIRNEIVKLMNYEQYVTKNWQKLEFRLPGMDTVILEEVGFLFVCMEGGARETKFTEILYLDDFEILHSADYRMDLKKLPLEKWTPLHIQPAHFSYLRGMLRVEADGLAISGSGLPAECYTGNIHWKNVELFVSVRPVKGPNHNVLFRVQGGARCMAAGFAEGNRFQLYRKDREYEILESVSFCWEYNTFYRVSIQCKENHIRIAVEDTVLIDRDFALEKVYQSGCIGLGNQNGSRTVYASYQLLELLE